jgi:uncharacterized protein
MDNQYLYLSWNQYHLLAQKLAAAILNHSGKFDEIVTIARGGLTLGHLLSDFLQLPVYSITIQSYSDIQAQGELVITQELGKSIKGKRILLVDDVSDSGKTFVRAKDYLKTLEPEEITTVAIFLKPHTSYRPDYYTRQTTKWIVFPYEVAETIIYITQKMGSDGKTKAQIQDFLLKLGFNENQIAFVRKHHLDK